MKIVFYIILTVFLSSHVYAQTDPTMLWIFRMEQHANEGALYKKLHGSNDGFPQSAGLFSKNDTIKYPSGQIFRTCEVYENKLHGQYNVYYSSGQLYMLSTYKNNVPTDSTLIFNDKNQLGTIITYISPTRERLVFFDAANKIKRIDNITIVQANQVTFQSGYVHTNTKREIKTEYFDPQGKKINEKAYFRLYPDEKGKKDL